MRSKWFIRLTVFFLIVSLSTSTVLSSPEAGNGDVIFQHDFSDGMPEEFQASASYPDSGTWGRAHDLSGGGVYDPASIDSERLRMVGPSCSYKGTAYPVTVDKDIQDWEISYRVDARPGSTGHGNRITGGLQAIGGEPQGNYNDDVSELGSGRAGFWDYGSTYRVSGLDSEGNSVSESASTDIDDIRNGKWNVRVASSQEETTTWVKYWQEGDPEPENWTHTFEDLYLDGRPGFEAYGTCKGSSRSNYYDFYELREIGLKGDFCNRRGPANECIMDQENELNEPSIDISSRFQALKNASFISEQHTSLNLTNSTEISGIWRGDMTIKTENPVLKAGARFRAFNTIIIGESFN